MVLPYVTQCSDRHLKQVFALNTVVATETGSIAERTVVALAAFRRNGEADHHE